jgi:hypothetical protein
MTRHVNHRGWIVRHSIASDDGHLCVDFFEDPEGRFGFELFRADPEDGGSWQSLAHYGAFRYTSLLDSVHGAVDAVEWLTTQPKASAAFANWQGEIARRQAGPPLGILAHA